MAEAGGKRSRKSCRETSATVSAGGRRKAPRVEDNDREEGLMEGVRCGVEFFDQPCANLASALLGCVLVCRGEDGEECRGVVVEVEAYLGGEDRAAHSYNGRRSRANAAMYMAPGTAYVYSIYGMHCCFNVSSQGEGAAVLVRALCPVAGLEAMRSRREWKERGEGKQRKDSELCNGPGKLCQSMGITKQHDKMNMVTSSSLWLERGRPLPPELIEASPRVGIDYAGTEWAAAPLRFYQANSPFVSKTRTKR